MTNIGTLSVRVNAETRALVTGMNKARAAVRDFSTKTQGMLEANSQAMMSMGRKGMMMGAVISGAMTMAVKSFADLEQAMATATAVSTVTEKQLGKMTEMATEMSKKWGVSASNTARAFYFLGSAGLKAQEQIAAFPAVTTLAKAAMIDMGSAAEMTVDTMKGFKIPFSDTTRVTDILTKAVTSSNMTFAQLGESMSYVSGTARVSNMSLEETTAVLGTMANVGIKGSMAGTTLRRALINLSAPSGEARKVLEELGISVYDADGKMRSLTNILTLLVPAFDKVSEETKNMAMKTLFGARAITGMTEMIYQGADGLRDFTDQLKDSAGVCEEVAEKITETLTGSFQKLGKEISAVVRIMGKDLVPVVNKLAKDMGELTKKIEGMPAPLRKVAVGATALTGATLLLGGGMLFLLGQIGHAITGWKNLIKVAPWVLKAVRGITAVVKASAFSLGFYTAAIGLWVSHLIKQIQIAINLKRVNAENIKVFDMAVKSYSNLNKKFLEGEISSKRYQKQIKYLNNTMKDTGFIPFIIPKHIQEIIDARKEVKNLGNEMGNVVDKKKDLVSELIGAFEWKPPAMAFGGGATLGYKPSLGLGMASREFERGGVTYLNITMPVSDSREDLRRNFDKALDRLPSPPN